MKVDEFIKNVAKECYDTRVSNGDIKLYSCLTRQVNDRYFMVLDPRYSDLQIDTDWNLLDDLSPNEVLYILKQVEELKRTPVKERFPEKKYYLNAHPEALEQYGSDDLYISGISYGTKGFSFSFGPATEFSESWLAALKKSIPVLAKAIETMKEPVDK